MVPHPTATCRTLIYSTEALQHIQSVCTVGPRSFDDWEPKKGNSYPVTAFTWLSNVCLGKHCTLPWKLEAQNRSTFAVLQWRDKLDNWTKYAVKCALERKTQSRAYCIKHKTMLSFFHLIIVQADLKWEITKTQTDDKTPAKYKLKCTCLWKVDAYKESQE